MLGGVFLGSQEDNEYLFEQRARDSYPDVFDRYASFIRHRPHKALTEDDKQGSLIHAYHKLITDSSDMETQRAAVSEFVRLELSLSKTIPDPDRVESILADPSTCVPLAAFEAHFMVHRCFLSERYILNNIHVIRDAKIKVQIIHGRCDFVCKPEV